jgi:hypothetical protein
MFLAQQPQGASSSSFTTFLDHTQRRTTVGRTYLDKWSARRRDLYLTTHNTHNTQTSMSPAGFGPTVSAGERPLIYALDRAATGTSLNWCRLIYLNTHSRLLWRGKKWSLATRKGHKYCVLENIVVRKIFGLKQHSVNEQFRISDDNKRHEFCMLHSVLRT